MVGRSIAVAICYLSSSTSGACVIYNLSFFVYVLSVTDTTVKVRCKVIAIGQTAVLVRGEITSEDGSIIYDVLDHNKINVRLKPRAPGSKL